MSIDQSLLEAVRTKIDVETERTLGTITDVMIRRYARAIGDTNRLYYDAEHARELGHVDIVAPPNFVTAVSLWDEGPANDELREDGTPPAAAQLVDLPVSGVRVMGGGASTEFHHPVTAGTTLTERTRMVDAELRQGTKGSMIVATYRHEFVDQDGLLLLTSNRTVLIR